MFSDHTRDFVFILTLLSSNPLLNYWAIQLPRKIPLPYIYHYFVLFSHETDFIILLHCILQSDRIFSGYKSCHLKISDVSANILPWTREQMMPATSLSFNQLAQLIVREDFIKTLKVHTEVTRAYYRASLFNLAQPLVQFPICDSFDWFQVFAAVNCWC